MKEGEEMARPAKNIAVISKHLTNEEKMRRLERENAVKGARDKLYPPDHLTEKQVEVFNYILNELEESEILGNLDIYILATCAIAIDRLTEIENKINKDFRLITNNAIRAAKAEYSKDFYRCCSELSLSPQSRAKLANLNQNKKEDDPLLQALKDDGDD